MIKTTLLLLLLTVSTFQQNTLGSSDDASVSSEAITIDFGSVGAAPPTPMRNGRPLEGNIQGYQTTDQRAPVTGPVTDWSFVQTEKSSYTNSGWKFPGNTY